VLTETLPTTTLHSTNLQTSNLQSSGLAQNVILTEGTKLKKKKKNKHGRKLGGLKEEKIIDERTIT